MKTCSRCHVTKPLNEFYHHCDTKDGYHAWCKECKRNARHPCREPEHRRKWHEAYCIKNPNKGRDWNYRSKYGLTLVEYDAMVIKQDAKCAICGERSVGKNSRLHVDHSHCTGKVRELLCAKCNVGLGGFRDNTKLLRAAVKYVKKHEGAK